LNNISHSLFTAALQKIVSLKASIMNMKKKLLFCVLALMGSLFGKAQFTENFNDGDFTN